MQSKQHLINDDFEAYINLQPSLQEKYLELLSILGGKEYDFFYHLFQNVKISENLLLDSSLNGIQGMIHEIKKSEYDSFFEDYFKIDISNVDIIRVSTMPDYAEGFASSCGEDNHYIVLPKAGTHYFLSKDLIVHELGHTIEFSKRRKPKIENGIVSFPIISETIAHYYQFYYMLKFSNRKERLSVLASITEAYFYYKCLMIMHTKKVKSIENFDFNFILKHSDFKHIKNAYENIYTQSGLTLLENLIQKYESQMIHESFNLHIQRLGAFLAFNFLKYKLEINKLFFIDYSGKINLEKCLNQVGIDSKLALDFSSIDQTIQSFVDGTLEV
jgi:hypothetical protein